jgi:hypothetical protein
MTPRTRGRQEPRGVRQKRLDAHESLPRQLQRYETDRERRLVACAASRFGTAQNACQVFSLCI